MPLDYLTGKKIWILSPQSWGNMFISKHHYAIELAKAGNTVYFIQPPNDPSPNKYIEVKSHPDEPGLYIVSHRIWFPYWLKFHGLSIFHWLMHFQIKMLKNKLGEPDIVWSFDIGYIYPFSSFPKHIFKIFHPVDEPLSEISIAAAKGCDIVFSVTAEILQKYRHLSVPRHFINHGLSDEFLQIQPAVLKSNHTIQIGFSGNLLRPDIDRACLLQIIDESPSVTFHLWGAYLIKQSNIGGGTDASVADFVNSLQQRQNVVLHGPVPVRELAESYAAMDAFLICYDVTKDQSRGTNYHKILEYLSAGKVLIANNVTTYAGRPDLIEMIEERESNRSLPVLFKTIIAEIDSYNAPAAQKKRRDFAFENTYAKQIERIDNCISALKGTI